MNTICLLLNCYPTVTCVHESSKTGANWANVQIAQTICCSLVLIVAICVLGFLACKLIDHHAKKNVDVRKRGWDVEDKKRKLSSELLAMKLDILKAQCKEEKDIKFDPNAVEKFTTAIDDIITKKKQISEHNTINSETANHEEITQKN